MSWLVFWIDTRETNSRMSVAVTTMLTMIAYRFIAGTSIPQVAYLTLLDVFILGLTVLVFLTLVMATMCAYLVRHDMLSRAVRINYIVRCSFPLIFLLLIIIPLLFY